MTGFTVFVMKDKDLPQESWDKTVVDGTQQSLDLNELMPETNYFIQIFTHLEDGTVLPGLSTYRFKTFSNTYKGFKILHNV